MPERRAVLVYGYRSKDKTRKDYAVEECRSLCDAAGIEVVDTLMQQTDHPDPRIFFHRGKVEEIRRASEYHHADMIVTGMRMSWASARRLAEETGFPVMDRTELILEIFSMRADSRPSQIQVEIAALRHRLSSVNESGDSAEHSRGGTSRNRGAGEVRSVQLRREYAARIKELNQQLAKIERAESSAQHRRRRSLLRRAALVGYTNSGKSSFMNRVLQMCSHPGTEVLEEDQLFATLDTSVRNVRWGLQHFLLYDTVGFVSDLPHELIESFRSTLQSVRDADLLIHIIDISDPQYEEKTRICEQTLEEIGAGGIPVLRVYNKADKLKEETDCEPLVSCRTGEGMEAVLQTITERLYPEETVFECLIPYDKGDLMHRASQMIRIDILEENSEGYHIRVRGPEQLSGMLREYRIEENP